MPRVFISRMLETYFRRKWLYLLPIVLLVGLGVFSVLQSSSKYKSIGVIEVNRQTVYGEVSGAGGNDFGGDDPGTAISRRINTVLDTQVFMDSVVEIAGLGTAVDEGTVNQLKLRKSIAAGAQGDELVTIQAVTSDPELSRRLASATIDAYRSYEIQNRIASANAAIDAISQQIEDQERELSTSTGDAQQKGEIREGLAKLRTDLANANAVANTAAADIAARFPTVDEPEQPAGPEARRKADAQTIVMFFVLGVLVSAAAVVAGTFMDRTVRYSEEIESQLSVPALASVPDSRSALVPTGA